MWVRRGVNAEDLLTSFAGALEVHFEGGRKRKRASKPDVFTGLFCCDARYLEFDLEKSAIFIRFLI